MDWTQELKGVKQRKQQYLGLDKYYFKLNITVGFVFGFVLDQVLPGTFGLPMRILKRFGKTLYARSVKLNHYTNNTYIRGFLE